MAELVLLGVPLGNLEDFTRRQERSLREGHHFICEDTRNLIKLLQLLGISSEGKTFWSFHAQSGPEEIERLVLEIKRVGKAYLVSDAGSPLISDPGYPLIRACLAHDIALDTLPGPSAPVVALELMGLAPMPFHFHGFFPRENDRRLAKCIELATMKGTHLFFESPYRVVECLDCLSEKFPDSRFAVVREMTKLYQTTYRFQGREFSLLKSQIEIRGEFVVGLEIEQATQDYLPERKVKELALEVLNKQGKAKDLSKLLAVILGRPTNEIYQELIHAQK